MNILELLTKKLRHSDSASSPKALAATTPETPTVAPPNPTKTKEPPPSAALTMEQAVNMFTKIQEMLTDDQETLLAIPCKALLQPLPAPLRGLAWNPHTFPDMKLDVPRDAVLEQLKKGQIKFPLRDFLPALPKDWVKADPDAIVSLDLALVVEAIPPQWFNAAKPAAHAADAVKHIPDYFKPAAAPAAAPHATLPPAVVAAAAGPAAPLRALREGEWSGVETGSDAGAHVMDLNHADLKALLKLPGIGQLRAEAILKYRQDHGRFQTIFELAEVPGIGRKLFRQITGLTLRHRDRHEILCNLLGLEKTARPTLAQLAGHLCALPSVIGCVFSDHEGMPLTTAGLTEAEAAPLAAIVPHFFRRARRYLKTLDPQPLHTLVLPLGEKPVILMQAREFFLILVTPPGAALDPVLQRIAGIARELDWLLGQRAMVAL